MAVDSSSIMHFNKQSDSIWYLENFSFNILPLVFHPTHNIFRIHDERGQKGTQTPKDIGVSSEAVCNSIASNTRNPSSSREMTLSKSQYSFWVIGSHKTMSRRPSWTFRKQTRRRPASAGFQPMNIGGNELTRFGHTYPLGLRDDQGSVLSGREIVVHFWRGLRALIMSRT